MAKIGVFIGRFQPPHKCHMRTVRHALERVDVLVVVLGSHDSARTVKNPWTTAERIAMIVAPLPTELSRRLRFVAVRDHFYSDNAWLAELQTEVGKLPEVATAESVTLFGHEKDASGYYLRLFPGWRFEETPLWEDLGASDVRRMYFTFDTVGWRRLVEPATAEVMDAFTAGPAYTELRAEFQHMVEYHEMWRGAPFPVTFVTVDAVVVCSGHVLVTRRKGRPGKGLIALPGGFVGQKESLRDATLRELKDETAIALGRTELDARVRDYHPFDHPERSLRGRTITHAFCIDLGSSELPRVKGGSEAEGKAWWMPLAEVGSRRAEFFEDHAHIVMHFAGRF